MEISCISHVTNEVNPCGFSQEGSGSDRIASTGAQQQQQPCMLVVSVSRSGGWGWKGQHLGWRDRQLQQLQEGQG